MKKIFFILFTVVAAANVSAQQMQEFNQLYFEKEYGKKLARVLNNLKALPGASAISLKAIQAAAVGDTPLEDAFAAVEALKLTDTSGVNINEVSGLPAFTDLLGNDVILPKIEIAGVTNFNSETGFYGDIKLFTSGVSAKQVTYSKVFFSETSTYGISMSLNYLPKFGERSFKKINGDTQEESKWICGYLNFNYLGKNLYGVDTDNGSNDTTKFTTAMAHIKYGIQIIPFKNLLSFYADANHITALTSRESLVKYSPSLANGFTNFLVIGTKFLLAQGQDKKPLNMFVDFSAVVMSHALKKIFNTSDKIIPKISIGGSVRF